MSDAVCPGCGITLIQVKRSASVSAVGLLAVVLFLIGIAAMMFNFIYGIAIWILAAIISLASPKNRLSLPRVQARYCVFFLILALSIGAADAKQHHSAEEN